MNILFPGKAACMPVNSLCLLKIYLKRLPDEHQQNIFNGFYTPLARYVNIKFKHTISREKTPEKHVYGN